MVKLRRGFDLPAPEDPNLRHDTLFEFPNLDYLKPF